MKSENELHRIAIFGVGILIVTATFLHGQDNAVTVLGGQGMHTVLETEIGSLTSHPGDKFAMRLLEPVVVDSREVLPDGRSFPVNASSEQQRHSEFDSRLSVAVALGARWEDFRWKKGRTGWLRLRFDLEVPAAFVSGKPASTNPATR